MISAVVLVPDTWDGLDLALSREIAARSLAWLVSAVVAGVVRDVTLSATPGLGLTDLADQAGCELVHGDTEAQRLTLGVRACRTARVMVIRAGFQPEAGLIDEVEGFVRRSSAEATAVLRSVPTTFAGRLFPARSKVVGILAPTSLVVTSPSFDRLARAAGRSGAEFEARARSIR